MAIFSPVLLNRFEIQLLPEQTHTHTLHTKLALLKVEGSWEKVTYSLYLKWHCISEDIFLTFSILLVPLRLPSPTNELSQWPFACAAPSLFPYPVLPGPPSEFFSPLSLQLCRAVRRSRFCSQMYWPARRTTAPLGGRAQSLRRQCGHPRPFPSHSVSFSTSRFSSNLFLTLHLFNFLLEITKYLYSSQGFSPVFYWYNR